MTLEKLLEDREQWQNNTIEAIRERIIYKPKSIFNSSSGEKLVAIYGPPQIGKTTLILCLLGIAPEYQKKVYNDIRAGVPKGNSSTATAIIYQQNDTDEYGVKYGYSDQGIESCTDKELQYKLIDVRKKVESDSAGDDALHIYIPQKYFAENAADADRVGLNIVDLPGDGSRNLKEKAHADAMINKYMALATVNIIVCKANEIESLKTLQLPINVDWKKYPHKYIVAITSAYGVGTTKKYFKTRIEDRKEGFYEFLTRSYNGELKKSRSLSDIEAFPIDIGDSFEKVVNERDEHDKNTVIMTQSRILEEIRRSIHQRKGNSLKSTILDLKAYTTDYANQMCDELQKRLTDLSDEKSELIIDNEKIRNKIQTYNIKINELKGFHSKYETLRRYNVAIDKKFFSESIEKIVLSYSVNGRIKDKNQELIRKTRESLIELIQKESKKYPLANDYGRHEDLYQKINMETDFEAIIGAKIYKGGLFGKAKTRDFLIILPGLIDDFIDQLASEFDQQIEKQKGLVKKSNDDYLKCVQREKYLERDIIINSEKLGNIQNRINTLEEEIKVSNEIRDKDKKTINDYLCIADEEYVKYKNGLIEKLDSDMLSAEEKIAYLIYLCLIEKDFKSISEMG